ncbi:putative damage-inducible protein DinB [Vibrio crassostreae]|uniref:DinB family protein n=1 Tax=Vibrio TaxID=662 RepID=UPI00104C20DE|nr:MULTISPECIES: DinB family protein [Vibrio]NOJ07824.1 DinB family protein [Vibrio splendidus]TCN76054.1 putative damage-inducible protein DinB [Vibrio crassostreae]CAK2534009.1 putative damage-inducible protein DinB [Vibrio crassostreae]CAK2538270.1 putative damage-inducible protein DinB [Vibrio crassostreae]CAK3898502.1 putative damage-inducible protein DinB [Vibrio crassostreae]
MNKHIDGLLETFRENRKLTYALLEHLSEEQLVVTFQRPGLDNVSKQIQEMADVQGAFVEALFSGTIDFSTVPEVFDYRTSGSKSALLAYLQAADDKMETAIQASTMHPSVNWDGDSIDVCSHLCSLIAHETFHQGQLAMALYWLGIELPEIWGTMWAMPVTCNHESP